MLQEILAIIPEPIKDFATLLSYIQIAIGAIDLISDGAASKAIREFVNQLKK